VVTFPDPHTGGEYYLVKAFTANWRVTAAPTTNGIADVIVDEDPGDIWIYRGICCFVEQRFKWYFDFFSVRCCLGRYSLNRVRGGQARFAPKTPQTEPVPDGFGPSRMSDAPMPNEQNGEILHSVLLKT
jgi:hypothetical protein